MHDLDAAIAALWADARPRLMVRVDALEAAATGELDEVEWRRASVHAHTLAGTLGSFGFPGATAAARAAEAALVAHDRAALAAAVSDLRAALSSTGERR
jgi:HPt (histidine-containing phosphotransfer) domain-containing protein